MQLQIDRRPMSRGVTQLMYVGDDDAVENATSNSRGLDVLLAGVLLGYAYHAKGVNQAVAAGIGLVTALRALSR